MRGREGGREDGRMDGLTGGWLAFVDGEVLVDIADGFFGEEGGRIDEGGALRGGAEGVEEEEVGHDDA